MPVITIVPEHVLQVVFFQNHDGFSLVDSLFHLEALGLIAFFPFFQNKTKQNIAIVMCYPNTKFQEHIIV